MRKTAATNFLFVLISLPAATPGVCTGGPLDGLDFSVGGRVKIDAIYNDESTGGSKTNRSDLVFSPGSIPVPGRGEEELDLNARESRLWATARLPVYGRELAGYAEIDFFAIDRTSTGQPRLSNRPRLRHAYASFGGFTAGKTYTTFMNVSAYPELNDTNGPLGIINVRQELIRFEAFFDGGILSIAVEEPDSTLALNDGSGIAPEDDMPDFVTKIEINGGWGNWTLAAMAREIRNDGTVAADAEDGEWGGAISVAGRIHLPGRDNIRFTASYGNTLGRYLSFNVFDDGVAGDTGNINLSEIAGGYLSYQHWWTENLRSSITAGYAEADYDTPVAAAGFDKSFYSTHLNLIWNPTLKASIGLEWLHGHRERLDGKEGDLNRLQLTAIYKF